MRRSWLDSLARCLIPAMGIAAGLLSCPGLAPADDLKAPPRPFPERVLLRGPDAVQQLVVEGPDGIDLTRSARYRATVPSVAAVDAAGTITARGNGSTAVVVEAGGVEASVSVSVTEFSPGPAVHFANQVVPVFTKLGCNSGGCHGKASGQNGFKLSLLGFEPDFDYDSLVHEGRGRRIFPAAPEEACSSRKPMEGLPMAAVVAWIGARMNID